MTSAGRHLHSLVIRGPVGKEGAYSRYQSSDRGCLLRMVALERERREGGEMAESAQPDQTSLAQRFKVRSPNQVETESRIVLHCVI